APDRRPAQRPAVALGPGRRGVDAGGGHSGAADARLDRDQAGRGHGGPGRPLLPGPADQHEKEACMSILSVENLSVRLGDKAVLNGVDAAFAPGLVTAIVGPNGAGKSTLLDCLAVLRTPDAGRVTLDGRALRDLPARTRSRRIAYLPQNAEIAWAVEGRTFVGLGR